MTMKGGKTLSKKKKETDFLSISARVRVMETRLLTTERMERMIDARDATEAAKVLDECGYPDLAQVTPSAVEDMLAQAQGTLFEDLGKAVDDPALLDLFRCKYDYHNAKVLIKSAALGLDQDQLLLRGGRYEPEKLAEDFRREDLRSCVPVFQEAVAHARELLGSSGDPQQADFVLDRAYYAELTQLAQQSGSPFLQGYVTLAIDSANLRAAVRAARLDKGPDFLRLVLVEGGAVLPADIAVTPGPDLARLYHSSPLLPAAEAGAALAVPNGGALTDFERLCDDALMAYMAKARMIPFGEQPVAAYLYAREAEATAIRIILTGRMAGIDGATIRARLRRAYC